MMFGFEFGAFLETFYRLGFIYGVSHATYKVLSTWFPQQFERSKASIKYWLQWAVPLQLQHLSVFDSTPILENQLGVLYMCWSDEDKGGHTFLVFEWIDPVTKLPKWAKVHFVYGREATTPSIDATGIMLSTLAWNINDLFPRFQVGDFTFARLPPYRNPTMNFERQILDLTSREARYSTPGNNPVFVTSRSGNEAHNCATATLAILNDVFGYNLQLPLTHVFRRPSDVVDYVRGTYPDLNSTPN